MTLNVRRICNGVRRDLEQGTVNLGRKSKRRADFIDRVVDRLESSLTSKRASQGTESLAVVETRDDVPVTAPIGRQGVTLMNEAASKAGDANNPFA